MPAIWDEKAERDSMSIPKDESGIRETVKRFILSSVHIAKIGDDDNLFEEGIVNSLFAVQLMTFVEKTFGIEVEMDDLDIENFKSLNATTGFVLRKTGRQS
jgi:methoxymalonate biosynthesis acyl carrier protein